MEFKGTKPPWKVSEHSNETAHIVTTPDTNVCNVFLGSVKGEQEANANLIAAAPELLEALQGVLLMTGNYDDMHISDQRKYLAAERAINKALNK